MSLSVNRREKISVRLKLRLIAILSLLIIPATLFAAENPTIRELSFVYLDPASGDLAPVDSPSPEWLAARTRLAPGLPYDAKVAEEDLLRFNTEYNMLAREIRPEPVTGGVRVVFVFERRPRVWNVEIKELPGTPGINEERLLLQNVRLRRDSIASVTAINADRIAITEQLRREGFFFASVNARYQPVDGRPGYVNVTFEVGRGPLVQPRKISIHGNKAYDDDTLRKYMHTREDGAFSSRRYDPAAVNSDIDNVRRFYLSNGYEDVQVSARPVLIDPEVVTVTLELSATPGPTVADVSVSGGGTVNRRDIRKVFESLEGRPYTTAKVEELAEWLKNQYRKTGYSVQPGDIKLSETPAAVTLKMIFGRSKENVTIDIITDQNIPPRVKDVRINTTGIGNLLQFMTLNVGQIFTEESLLRDSAAVIGQITSQTEGKLTLLDSAYERTAEGFRASHNFMWAGSDAWLRIDIIEGSRYTVGNINFEGAVPAIEENIRDRIRLVPGKVFNRRDLAHDLDVIRLAHRERGYAAVEASLDEARIIRPGTNTYDLTYKVTPGPMHYIELIRPRGNDITQPVVITREMALQPGDRYDDRKIQDSVRRLKNTGHFTKVDVRHVETRREDSKRYLDLEVTVEEAPPGRFMVGVGASSSAGVFADIRVRSQNFDISDWPDSWSDFISGHGFSGRGQSLELVLQPGSKQTRFNINFREPWLNDRPISLDVGLGLNEREWDEYTLTRLGVNVKVGKRIMPDVTIFSGLRIENVKVDDIDDDAATEIVDDEGSFTLMGLSAGITQNTIDDTLYPTTGERWTMMAELIAGSDAGALKLTADRRTYQTIYEAEDGTKHVLSFWGGAGTIIGDVPFFEKFYAGGLGSVRGFAPHGISPLGDRRYVDPDNKGLGKLPISGDPIGGNFLVEGGVEYLFPIIKDTLRGVIFLDAGSVAENTLGIGDAISDIRISTGFGFHLQLPQLDRVPLVIYIGIPLKKESGDETQAVSFSIGFVFP